MRDRDGYAWWNHQYVEQLTSRFDVGGFREKDDREERVDYEALRTGKPWPEAAAKEVEKALERELEIEGRIFATITHNKSQDDEVYKPEPTYRFLMGVPTGSTPADFASDETLTRA